MMHNEIGGFFEFPSNLDSDSQESVYYFLFERKSFMKFNKKFIRDGRQAIKYVLYENLEKLKNMKCYLPAYLCESILQPFIELNLSYSFYNLQKPMIPIIDLKIETSLLFIIDYFGVESITNEDVLHFANQGCLIIIDISHSFFKSTRFDLNHKNIFLIGSLRKLFSIPDGGIIYSNIEMGKQVLEKPSKYEKMLEAMFLKKFYLKSKEKGNYKLLKDYFLQIYKNYEEKKDRNTIVLQKIPQISLEILKKLNFNTIRKRREENIQFLMDHINPEYLLYERNQIPSIFILKFSTNSIRNSVKKELIQKKIFTPIHWILPKLVPLSFTYEHALSNSLLTIPIDQRYSLEDFSPQLKQFPKLFN